MPTPRKVNRNSKGKGGFKSPIFKGKYGTKMEFPEGVGVQAKITFRGRSVYFLHLGDTQFYNPSNIFAHAQLV